MKPLAKTLAIALLAPAAMAATLTAPAAAQSAGDMTLGFGVASVNPKSGNGTVAGLGADIGNDIRPTITFEYFIRDNIGIEVLGALPFKHDISLAGAGRIGSTKHLPPTVSVNWHIPTAGPLTPFVGVGVNYTTFFEDRSPLGELQIEDSWGLAASLGVDYALTDSSALRLNVRYVDIDADVKLNGTKVGKVNIDPVVTGISYVMKF